MASLSRPHGQSLHVLLTALICSLVIATALGLGLFYQQALREQQLSAQRDLFAATARQITSNIAEYRTQADASSRQIAQSDIALTYSHEERAQYVGQMVSLLRVYPALQAVYTAYPNGDFFLLRRYDDATRRNLDAAPPQTRWVAQYVSQYPDGHSEQRFHFLDDELVERATPQSSTKFYDPRQRPWFAQADGKASLIGTQPYRFATTGQSGITFAYQRPDQSMTVGVDFRLQTLSEVLKVNRPSPGARMAIINATRQVIVSADVAEDASVPLALAEFPSPELAEAGRRWQRQGALPTTFDFQGRRWHASLLPLQASDAKGPRLLMLMPEDELFADGARIARQAMWIPLALLLLLLPLGWWLSRLLSRPIRRLVRASERIRSLDFSDAPLQPSKVRELNELMAASESMKKTIRDFIGLSRQIVSESTLQSLLDMVLQSTMRALPAQQGALWLLEENGLAPCHGIAAGGDYYLPPPLPADSAPLQALLRGELAQLCLSPDDDTLPAALRPLLAADSHTLILLPLRLQEQETLGLMALSCRNSVEQLEASHRIGYLQALVSFAAIAIDNRRLAAALQQLMNALVELIAGAIDAKSPYTAGHCQRVPDIAQALAEAAHQAQHGTLAAFRMNAADREALYIASWLHDCGKVTTPEYVVDKATKLETIYDRIHEIRTRFEVLKRDAELAYWQGVAGGGDAATLATVRDAELAALDADFAFVARCNQGGEFMRDEDIARLQQIGARRWTRTLDDRLGLGPLELERLAHFPRAPLPAEEALLADKAEHLFPRTEREAMPADNPWGFNMRVPPLLFNRGELANLVIRRGTLTEEERYKINEHIVETIKMLTAMPFPRHLRTVPEIAGGHHERIDGKGYPRGLHGEDMSVLARVMAIADVFEALTASDRPYKPAKPLSEALRIMAQMSAEGHLDHELFQLFLQQRLWLDYAERYLAPQQRDLDDFPPAASSQPARPQPA